MTRDKRFRLINNSLFTLLLFLKNRKEKKEIISSRCLEAVKETMEVIKDSKYKYVCKGF